MIADVLIVGAGSAGCVLAARLSERSDRQVVLLEAGPDLRAAELPHELRTLSQPVSWPYDWGNEVEEAGGRRLFYGRGRGVGGSSGTNGAVALRPEPSDADRWPEGWRWHDLLPALNAIEHDLDFGDRPWHGTYGPVPIVRWAEAQWTPMQAGFVAGCEAVGFPRCADHNEPGTTGVGAIPMNRVGNQRVSASAAFLEPARERPNLTVLGGQHVRRVVIEDGRAIGVELDDGSVIRAGEVILSAGVIQDPLLLQRSGIGPADRLRASGFEVHADLPDVGAHLTDHMVVTFAAEIDPRCAPEGAPSLQTILRATSSTGPQHDLQFTPFVRRHPDGRRSLAMSVALQLPEGEGSVVAATDGQPVIRWPFTAEPANLRRLRDGWRMAAAIAVASGLALDPAATARSGEAADDDLDVLITEQHSAFYHGVGTCRMGAPGSSVVDDRCRVYGVAGLSIVDASVIPTVPRTNTNLAVMALAERYATARRSE